MPTSHHSAPESHHVPHQRVLNASWPFRDENGHHARGIKDQRHSIPVTVRVVFETDGQTWLEGKADRWHGQHVHVSLWDDRLQVNGVWVLAGDVTRLDDARST